MFVFAANVDLSHLGICRGTWIQKGIRSTRNGFWINCVEFKQDGPLRFKLKGVLRRSSHWRLCSPRLANASGECCLEYDATEFIKLDNWKMCARHLLACICSHVLAAIWSLQRSYRSVGLCARARNDCIVVLVCSETAIVSLFWHVHWQRSYRCVGACNDSDRIVV